jgi:hypothetical protein
MATTQDPRKQAMYEQAGKQALKALSSPEGADMVANDAIVNGSAQAIVNALQGVEQVIVQAAGGAGVDIPPDVLEATRMSMATLLVAMMVESGLAEDPDALMQELAPMLQGGAEAEDDDEAGEDGEDEMEVEEPDEMPAGGALMAARRM